MKQIYFLFLSLMLSIGTVQAGIPPEFSVANADGILISYAKCEHFPDLCDGNRLIVSWPEAGEPYAGEVIIPSLVLHEGKTYSVVGIGIYVFSDCSNLRGVGIPESVRYIHSWAFDNNPNLTALTDIYVSWSDPSIVTIDEPFRGLTAADITLHVPIGAKAAYENSNVWKDFNIVDDGKTIGERDGVAWLANLAVSYGTLSPAFTPSQLTYRLVVPQSVDQITLTATPMYGTASGDGVKMLNIGENTFEITVTSADGALQNTYTVTVYRHSEDYFLELNEDYNRIYTTIYHEFYWPSTRTDYRIPLSVISGYSFYYTLQTGNFSGNLPLVFILNELKTCNRTIAAEPHSIYKIKLDIVELEYYGNGQYGLGFSTTADAYGRPAETTVNYTYYSMPIRVLTGGNPLHEGEVQMTGFPNTATISDVTLEWHTGITSAESNPLRVYSHPAANRLTLSGLQGNETLRIYSISGNLLLSDKATGETTVIDIARLPAGIYLVGIQSDKGISTHKFIKQ